MTKGYKLKKNERSYNDACMFLTNRKLLLICPVFDYNQGSKMEALYMLIGFSLLVAVGFLCAFFWAVRSGQFNDKYTPAVRMLFNDESKPNDKK